MASEPSANKPRPLHPRIVHLALIVFAAIAVLEALALRERAASLVAEPGGLFRIDFAAALTGAHLVASGEAARLYDSDRQRAVQAQLARSDGDARSFLPFVHPPFLLIPILPLVELAPERAYAIHGAGSALLLFAVLALLARKEGLRGPLPVLVPATYLPVASLLVLGQSTILPLAGLGLSRRAFLEGREAAGGAWLALVAAKPQYAPFFPLLLIAVRRWRALGGFALGLALLYLAGAAVAGLSWPAGYAEILIRQARGGSEIGVHPLAMHNLRGLLHAAFAEIEPGRALVVSVTAAVIVFVLLLRRWPREWTARPRSFNLAWALAVVVILLASPHANTHDLTLLVLPGLVIASECLGSDRGPFWLALLWIVYLAPPLTVLGIGLDPLVRPTVFASMALGLALERELRRQP